MQKELKEKRNGKTAKASEENSKRMATKKGLKKFMVLMVVGYLTSKGYVVESDGYRIGQLVHSEFGWKWKRERGHSSPRTHFLMVNVATYFYRHHLESLRND